MYSILILDYAYSDKNAIYEFCLKVNSNYATKVINRIDNAIQSLKYFPFINPLYIVLDNTIFRKRIVDKRYIIIFSIIGQTIVVFRIIDGRRNITPTDLFKTN